MQPVRTANTSAGDGAGTAVATRGGLTRGGATRTATPRGGATRGGATRGAAAPGLRVRLLSGFQLLREGVPVEVQPRGQRVLALLALRGQPVTRVQVAATLWLDTDDEQALASLRSTLWRLNHDEPVVVPGRRGQVQLRAGTQVDVLDMVAQARRLTDAHPGLQPGDEDLLPLRDELLPGWWDEWVIAEREWLRQLQLHALEQLARRLLDAGRHTRALEAGLAAVAAEPLRESAQRAVIAIHLAEGNRSEALRQYTAYARLVRAELGGAPSPQLERLIAGSAPARPAAAPVTPR